MATQTVTELQALQLPLEPQSLNPTPLVSSYATSRHSRESTGPIDRPPIETSPAPESTTVEPATSTTASTLPKGQAIIVIAQLTGLLFFSSFCNGVVVVALPAMQSHLNIQEGLLVWPTSSYYLTAGTCLLLAGSIADVVGAKRMNIIGGFLAAVFTLACGLAQTGDQMIAFRAFQGVTNAIIIPSSVSIISRHVEEGRPRNIGFSCLGFGQPLGFSFGLVLGGVLTDTVGWRPGFYLAGAATFALFLISPWSLPKDSPSVSTSGPSVGKRLAAEIDWFGVFLASVSLATLSYVLATLSADINNIRRPENIAMLIISGCSIPLFAGWMHYQVKNNRTALIPNSLWRSHVFTSCCIMVLLTTALVNTMELYSSLFFQEVQGSTAISTSLQVLPSLIAGTVTSILTGIFVSRMPVLWAVLAAGAMSTVAPLLMALVRIDQTYWENAFWGQILSPIACDMLFTVGLLIISDVYPKHMQALGGAVFNTCAQLGTAIGLSITQVVASSVTAGSGHVDKHSPEALMAGYRAAFWTMFGWMALVCLVCVMGLRKVQRLGVKRD